MPSGLSLEGNKEPGEVARFEIIVNDNGDVTIPEEYLEKYTAGSLVMWVRHLAFTLEMSMNASFVEQRLNEQLEELEDG